MNWCLGHFLWNCPLGEYHSTPLISQYWYRKLFVVFRQQAITRATVDPDLYHHMVSLGHSNLIRYSFLYLRYSNAIRMTHECLCMYVCISSYMWYELCLSMFLGVVFCADHITTPSAMVCKLYHNCHYMLAYIAANGLPYLPQGSMPTKVSVTLLCFIKHIWIREVCHL